MSEREELLSGFKNALERGESVEKAKQTFLNSGYKSTEVDEAAQAASSGVVTIAQPNQLQQPGQAMIQTPKSSKKKWIIIISIFLLVLILTLAGLFIFM